MATVWNRYSAINSYFKTEYATNINTYATLRVFMINLTKTYIPKKAKILTYQQIKKVIALLNDGKDDILYRVIVLLMYFGLLRGTEVLNIKYEEVTFLDSGEVQIEYCTSSKTRIAGFSYLIPAQYKKEFKAYMDDWCPETGNFFLKNYRKDINKRKTKTGWRTLQNMTARVEELLKLPKGSLTTHSFRRSSATALANAGASLIQLKRAGRWQSSAVAEGYIEHCLPEKRKQVTMMADGDAIDITSVSFFIHIYNMF